MTFSSVETDFKSKVKNKTKQTKHYSEEEIWKGIWKGTKTEILKWLGLCNIILDFGFLECTLVCIKMSRNYVK